MGVRAVGSDNKIIQQFLRHPEAFKKALLESAAGQSKTLVKQEFRNSSGPDGKPWVRLKGRRGAPLRKTGKLGNSFFAYAIAKGFEVGTNDAVVIFHQQGTKGHSRDFTRRQAFSENLRFTRNDRFRMGKNNKWRRIKGGRARVTTLLPDNKIRTVTRTMNGQVTKVVIRTKKVLTKRAIAGHYVLHFKRGNGAIPARQMVPPNGQLTPLWLSSIDKSCDATAKRLFRQAKATT